MFELVDNAPSSSAVIKVVGVGGGASGLDGIGFGGKIGPANEAAIPPPTATALAPALDPALPCFTWIDGRAGGSVARG